jgi:cytochrome o ubiquinol oxidase subunit II
MARTKKTSGHGKMAGLIVLVLAYLAVLITVLLQGQNVALFNPKGLVANEQMRLMVITIGVMLVIGIPALFLFYFTAWKYRESNHKAKRDPHAGHSKRLNALMWLAPGAIAIILAFVLWPATHKLEPQKQIENGAKPLTIQVVAQRWKWLFIYPEQQIATVNFVQIPVDTPVTFELTADETPMSGFWIPNLGGMLYAMTGHVNRLNLVAGTPGDYPGSTAEINGPGFAGMKFTARASTKDSFDFWVRSIKSSSGALDSDEYDKLLEPSENHPAAFYSLTDTDLYATVLSKYAGGGHDHQPAPHEGAHH